MELFVFINRYLFLSLGGCALAVVTMGIYSLLLFFSTFVFVFLVCSVGPGYIHPWVFGIQMFWQTFWHLLIQYREYYLHEPTSIRLFTAVSSLMLLTQRITSVSMDLQEGRLNLPSEASPQRRGWIQLLPLCSYVLNFTTLLGGPLFSYSHFVLFIKGVGLGHPPNPPGAVYLKMLQVLSLECVRYGLIYFLKSHSYDPSSSGVLSGVLWLWCLAVVLRIQYYSHWRMSECLNNAAGLGFWASSSGNPPEWSGLSDGDLWTTETSVRVSEFARRWNATTASWLRRLVFRRCKSFPLFMTFGFSVWWHGLHLGQLVGFFGWAAAVKADYWIHRYLCPKLTSTWKKRLYTCFSWTNTQMIITCVVVMVELRDLSSLRLLSVTHLV
ncbi:ghrelin O-acyltransferase [Polymixia lowei]